MVAWTGIARGEHSREGLRYPSDMTDAEWALAAPFVPPARCGGRPRTTNMREVVNALLYVAASGCAWRLLPKCFPPVSTVRRYFYAWRDTGLFQAINTVLVMNLREIEGREASPSAGVIDSQSVKTTESGGISGYAGKKIKGRKRHILTDTCGFLIFILVHSADIQDRDGAVDVLTAVRNRFPWLRHVFADGGYAGDKLRSALLGMGKWTIDIIKRSDKDQGLRGATPSVGRRTNFRMARSLPEARQGLGKVRRIVHRLGLHRFNPHAHAQNRKVLSDLKNF